MAKKTEILNKIQIENKISRLAYAVMEEIFEEKELVIIGIEPNGNHLAGKISKIIKKELGIEVKILSMHINKTDPWKSEASVFEGKNSIEGKTVLLVDDVLNSGKTMAYALKIIMEHRVKKLKTLVLVDRDHKDFPVKADFVGLSLSTNLQSHIQVDFNSPENAYIK